MTQTEPMRSISRVCVSIALATGLDFPIQLMPADAAASVRQGTASPGRRSGHSLVYDPVRRRLVVIDGYVPPHDSSPGELWTWDGRQWELLPGSASGPSKRIVGWREE